MPKTNDIIPQIFDSSSKEISNFYSKREKKFLLKIHSMPFSRILLTTSILTALINF